jgi:hypothetical protein
MADKTVKTRVQIKRGTEADWKAASRADFKPLNGELIYYTDKGILKIGNNTDTPDDLPALAREDNIQIYDVFDQSYARGAIAGLDYQGSDNPAMYAVDLVEIEYDEMDAPAWYHLLNKGEDGVPVYVKDGKIEAVTHLKGYAKAPDVEALKEDAIAATALVKATTNEAGTQTTRELVNVGTNLKPVHFVNGVPEASDANMAVGDELGVAQQSKAIVGAGSGGVNTVGNATTPVFINSAGKPTACTGIALNINGDLQGNADSATRLKNTRKFSITNGATASAQSFNGTQDVSLAVSALSESYLTRGGKTVVTNGSAYDASLINDLSANRFAFIKNGITVEYSRDGGSSWTAVPKPATGWKMFSLLEGGTLDDNKLLRIGLADKDNPATATSALGKYQLRITLDMSTAGLYGTLDKFALWVSTDGNTDCRCQITTQKYKDSISNPSVWTSIANESTAVQSVPITGWSGWNVINCSPITTTQPPDWGTPSAEHVAKIRFTFWANGGANSDTYFGLQIKNIQAFGNPTWACPSDMARNGHLYKYDENQNAIFPGGVTLGNGNSTLNGIAERSKKLVNSSGETISMGNVREPVYFAGGVPVAAARIPQVSVVSTVPESGSGEVGDFVFIPRPSTDPAIYSGTTVPDHTIGVNGDIYIMYE